jgi:uncharacterized membrane protein YheB (UPF0754 family)
MDWTILAGPVIGAIIGYFTNYIAVKMLFRPFEPKYLFGHRIPLTPGMIPKSRDRIAESIGSAVGENLLTQDAMEQNLLSPEIKDKIRNKVDETIQRELEDQRQVRELLTSYVMEENTLDTMMEKGENLASSYITERITDMNLGHIVGTQVLKAIHEKQERSFWAKLITEDVIHSMVDTIERRVNQGVQEQGSVIIRVKIRQELDQIQYKTMGELFGLLQETCENPGDMVVNAYEVVIRKRLASILQTVDVAKVVREKLGAMDPRELERLVLKVAKKELGAIVNLGALIGFVLGCLNTAVDLLG